MAHGAYVVKYMYLSNNIYTYSAYPTIPTASMPRPELHLLFATLHETTVLPIYIHKSQRIDHWKGKD